MKHLSASENYTTDLHHWLTQFDAENLMTLLSHLFADTGLYIIDPQQRIIFWNSGAELLTGYRSIDMTGTTCSKQLGVAQQKGIQQKHIELTRPDGNPVPLQLIAKTTFNNAHRFTGALCLLVANKKPVSTSTPKSEPLAADDTNNFFGIISRSPQMEPVFQIIRNAAKTETTVLVRGESGSGKELVARAIHDLSPRQQAPFLAINCAALSSNLLESELFGHVRGAFSGAVKDHAGLFERANGGTLFLDEVAELPLELQAKLLRVLQEKNFIPVGGAKSYDADVRIVAATHRSLRDQVKKGLFREDLMYRLRVVPIFIPSLRERREDIPLLLWHFINQHNLKGYRKITTIDPAAMRLLLDYPWPGNIRELQNVMEYAFVVGHETSLLASELPPEFREQSTEHVNSSTPSLSIQDEKATILNALKQNQNKVSLAAASLGMSRATFWRKRKQYQI